MNFLREFYNRWNENSPLFFKKIRSFGAWLTATGTALVAVPATLNATVDTGMDLSILATISSYIILAGLILTAVSKLPVKNPDYENLDKRNNN